MFHKAEGKCLIYKLQILQLMYTYKYYKFRPNSFDVLGQKNAPNYNPFVENVRSERNLDAGPVCRILKARS